MTRMRHLAAVAVCVLTATPAAAASPFGVWSNPRGSLMIRTTACNGGLCGAIVWANGAARADAREAGVAHLIGTQLLRNYRADASGTWSGRFYVPDMGRSFPSHLKLVAPDRLKISGCLIRHYFCRSQEWHRLQ
ncbi:MAG: DUF2147 domain-containing protein [Sphingomonas sp.]|nr:DUF2147 domain-containing protein [Sphingomonas sp.]